MKKTLTIRAILWGLGFFLVFVITALTLETMIESPSILAYLIALVIAFFVFLRYDVVYGGVKMDVLQSAVKQGAIIFLCINLVPLVFYVYLMAISEFLLGIILFVLTAFPVVCFFLFIKVFPRYFLTVDFDVCPRCDTICYRASKKLTDIHQTTTYETSTSREKLGEIHSTDGTEHYDVYGDVSHTESHTETTYNYNFSHQCKCGYRWSRKVQTLDFLGRW